jgi:hypothetical protein
MSFIVRTDFVGEFKISQNRWANTDHDAIIASVEEKILKDLLGEDLYLKLIADLNGSYVPQTQKYIDLVNSKTYTVVNVDGVTVNVNYQGIKKMLKYFTYAELLKFQSTQNTEVGQVEPSQNNSTKVAPVNLSGLISDSYNKGLDLYGFDIQTYGNYNSLIRGLKDSSVKKYTEYDYYELLVKGSCFNYLWYQYENNPTYFPTWQFTVKDYIFIGGYL